MPRPTAPDRGERLRKAIHLAAGVPAFGIRWMGAAGTLGLLAAALAFNAWLLPRLGGRAVWRREERWAGAAPAIVAFPAVLLALAAIFARRLEVVAAAWGILAFGDGLASLARGGPPLPWNRAKSWRGSAACWLGGWAAAAALVLWTAPGRYPAGLAVAATGVAALAAAWVESQPWRLDDNLTVAPLAALTLWTLLETAGGWSALWRPGAWLAALAASAALAGAAWALGALTAAGAAAGLALGAAIGVGLGAGGLGLTALFVGLGSAATRVGARRKARRGLAEARGGRRGAGNALANGLVPAACALLAAAAADAEPVRWAFAAALATAASDTLASEIGQAAAGRTVLVTSGRRVPAGTDGGVSLAGSAAGLAGAGALAAGAWGLGLVPAAAVAPVAAAGLAGNAIDSLLGAALERRGLIDNQGVNFLSCVAGALVGAAAAVYG